MIRNGSNFFLFHSWLFCLSHLSKNCNTVLSPGVIQLICRHENAFTKSVTRLNEITYARYFCQPTNNRAFLSSECSAETVAQLLTCKYKNAHVCCFLRRRSLWILQLRTSGCEVKREKKGAAMVSPLVPRTLHLINSAGATAKDYNPSHLPY